MKQKPKVRKPKHTGPTKSRPTYPTQRTKWRSGKGLYKDRARRPGYHEGFME